MDVKIEYNKNMELKDTESFIKSQILNELDYSNEIINRYKTLSFQDREYFCLDIKYYFNYFYNNSFSFLKEIEFVSKYGLQYNNDTGWFKINNSIGKGKFVLASKLFPNAPCKIKDCHKCAYLFALNSNNNAILKSGFVNPFSTKKGFLHSICEFQMDDESFIFDGSNYLIMSKDLYVDLFKFEELSAITHRQLINDFKSLSKINYLNKPTLKSDKEKIYYMNFNNDIIKAFEGLGFCLYLYDRKNFINEVPFYSKELHNKKIKEYSHFLEDYLEKELKTNSNNDLEK